MPFFEFRVNPALENIDKIQQVRESLRSFGKVRLSTVQGVDEVIIGIANVHEDQIEELEKVVFSIRPDIKLERTDKIVRKRNLQ